MLGETTHRARAWSGALAVLLPEQAATEYAATTVRDMLRWSGQAIQEHWYYVLGVVVLLVLIWGYLSK